nr:Sulfatase [uncultured organism]
MTSFSRREVLGAGGAAVATLASASTSAAGGPDRPNILWLVSEDNNPFIGAYGDRLAHTPNIDGLAKNGLLYRNAFSNAPVCAPSRFGILTGVYPEANAPANHMRARATLPAMLKTYPELLRSAGYYCTNNVKTDYNCDIDPDRIWDASSSQAHWKNRPAGKPFMAVFNFMTTHESQLFEATPGRVKPENIRLPAYLPDTPGIRRDYASYYNLIEKMDAQVGAKLDELEAAGLAEDTIVFYYSDNGGVLPRSKRYCYEQGLHCAMVVRVPPKWAHLMPQRAGSEVTAPVSFIDLAPTLLAIVGEPIPATMQGQPFLGRAKLRPQRYAFGMRNRMDERYDMVRTVGDGRYRYIRNYLPYLPAIQNQAYEWLAVGYQDWDALRRAGKLTPIQARPFEARPYEEFYDLKADPDQIDNRIADAAYGPRIAAMRKALDLHMLRIGDNGFMPEGVATEGYSASRAAGAYPLRRIMALAQAAARRDTRKIALLQSALTDSNETIRWWGATGLAMLNEGARPAAASLVRMMNDDPAPQVRIAAAEACAAAGRPIAAVSALAMMLAPGHAMPVRLQAVNALTRLGRPALAAMAPLRAMMKDETDYLRNTSQFLIETLEGRYDPHTPIFDVERMRRNPPR